MSEADLTLSLLINLALELLPRKSLNLANVGAGIAPLQHLQVTKVGLA